MQIQKITYLAFTFFPCIVIGTHRFADNPSLSGFTLRAARLADYANDWLLEHQIFVAIALIGGSILFFILVDTNPSSTPESRAKALAGATPRVPKLGEPKKVTMEAPPFTPNPPKDDPYTTEELKKYDGSIEGNPIYVAIKGQIFDVSAKKEMYGPGGGYHIFAGKDGSRGLGRSSLKPEDAVADYSPLDPSEVGVLEDWVKYFTKRYNVVGKVVDA